jgi:hypothetical protein
LLLFIFSHAEKPLTRFVAHLEEHLPRVMPLAQPCTAKGIIEFCYDLHLMQLCYQPFFALEITSKTKFFFSTYENTKKIKKKIWTLALNVN